MVLGKGHMARRHGGTAMAILGVVTASRGRRGACRSRGAPGRTGLAKTRGAERFESGAWRGRGAWPMPAAIAVTARNREGGEREMEVMADL